MMETQIQTSSNDTKRKQIEDSLDIFGVDRRDFKFEKEFIYELQIPPEDKSRMLSISRMIKVAVLTLKGYEEQPSTEVKTSQFKLVNEPFGSSQVIKAFESILKPYADESNILTKKDWDSFKIQAMSDWRAFYKFCIRNKAQPNTHLRTVYRVFQDCIINIGEITCDNPDNMNKVMGQELRNEMQEGVNSFR